MDARTLAVGTFVPMLRNLVGLLDKATQAENTNALPEARLAPDMFPLHQQVQLSCFHASSAIVRLNGKDPGHADMPVESLADLKARVEKAIAGLEDVKTLDGAAQVVIPLPDGKMRFEMTGLEFLQEWALPHFYFHVVTAYDILRHEGVPLGKPDYLASVARRLRQS